MSARRRPLALLLVVLAAGCTLPVKKEADPSLPPSAPPPVEERVLPPVPTPVPVPAPAPPLEVRAPSELERALAYFDRLRRMPAAEIGREQEAVRVAFGQSRSDFDRVRLAMTYALPNTPFHDEGRALDLLEPLVKNTRAELHHLAVFVGVFAQEQKRLGANVHALQQGVQALQQKLDALRSLERSLIEREGGAARRR
jgi:hypothetical protein